MTSPIAIEIVEGPLREIPFSLRLSQGLALNQEAIAVLQPAVVHVGRGLDCQICLPPDDDEVSRHHFALVVGAGGACIRDCGSRNGTFVNGVRLAGDDRQASHSSDPVVVKLKDGDQIMAGQTVFRISLGDQGTHAPLNQITPSPRPSPVMAQLGGNCEDQICPESEPPSPAFEVCDTGCQETASHPAQLLRLLLRASGLIAPQSPLP